MKVLENEKIRKIILSVVLVISLILGGTKTNYAGSAVVNGEQIETGSTNIYVVYNSHIQDYGWESDFSKTNGQTSGTTGKNKKNEAMKIKLINGGNIDIEYQAHVQDYGWMNWTKNGEMVGTTGKNKRMEAINIKLKNTNNYSVEYRVHVQDIGWMNWVKDGTTAGTIGRSLKIEAIEIRIVPKTLSVIYQSHVQDEGWQQYFNNGQTSGRVGKGLKVEGIKIELKNNNNDLKLVYQSHVQDYGWETNWKQNGELSGTTGQNKKIEAVKIKLEGTSASNYTVIYRTYLQGIGWQDWKKDGELSGTTGQNRKLEAIEIIVQPKNSDFQVKYSTHVQDIGWTNYQAQGTISGTTGQSKKIEAIKIEGKNTPENVSIKYQTYIQGIGWQDWKKDGEISGTTGQNKRVEGLRIKLEGTNANNYSITYRTHIQNVGWQDWANDGEITGLPGEGKRVEAIQIKIIPKVANRAISNIETNIATNIPQGELKIVGWVMANVDNVGIQVKINDKVVNTNIKRINRQDVLNSIKGYGGADKNPQPGFEITLDLTNTDLGNKTIKIQYIDSANKVLYEKTMTTKLCTKIQYQEGIYGQSGLKKAGKGGSNLKYLKYGSGENVFFATFAIHGYEDLWAKDGTELVNIANTFYNKLINDKDYNLAGKWTIYIFPGINQDGLTNGWTNDGPGRTTLYSQAPGNKGIDMNRCWQVGDTYTKYTDNRNYNGTTGFQAYEAQALRDFLLANKSKNGQTMLVDLHGWTQQVIGDSQICSYYSAQFPENDKSAVGRYGTGYLINWARNSLGSSGKAAKSALIELPHSGVTGHQSVVDKNFTNKYINATLSMLKSM